MALASLSFLCPDSAPNPFAFNDACIRASWSALLPLACSVLFCVIAFVPKPKRSSLFTAFLTLDEAASLSGSPPIQPHEIAPRPSKGTTIALASSALLQILLWSGIGIFQFQIAASTFAHGTNKIPFLLALSWLGGAGLLLGGAVFYPTPTESGYATTMVILVVNLALTAIPLIIVLRLPLALPVIEPVPGGLEPAPEDYTTLFSWITFAWVYPLIRRGTNNTLTEKDVWDLSPTTLLRSLLASNSLDLLLDAFLSIISVLLSFSGPVFLNLILQQLEHPVEGGQRLAYLYAFLGFVCQIAKSEADANHFYYGRRASTRIQTELMVAVYDKALKRRDFAGVVDVEAAKDAAAAKRDGKQKDDGKGIAATAQGTVVATKKKKDEGEKDTGPKKGAQLSKILNLMSVDASTVSSIPLSFSTSTARLSSLGSGVPPISPSRWAAFAGLFFVVISIPLSFLVAKLSVNYEKGIVTARDRRRVWSTSLSALGLPPLMISASSFFVYVKQGNELTVATAFTALAVSICVPLSVVPWIITYVLRASVALSRISTFLDEDEVSDEVSALKPTSALVEDDAELPGLAIQNGSFKWNEWEDGFMLALLGEMTSLPGTQIKPPKSSRVDENGLMHCCSYAAQTAWLQHASIKDNITFGFPFDEEDGDRTEIGVRGVTLSGGQKARVALARAVYAWTKYVLLDDPLSAVPHSSSFVRQALLWASLEEPDSGSRDPHIDLFLPANGSEPNILCACWTVALTPKALSKVLRAQDEEQAKGGVEWRIYKTYLKASSTWSGFSSCLGAFSSISWNWVRNSGSSLGRSISDHFDSDLLGFILAKSTRETIANSSLATAPPSGFPAAQDQPMFYIGIYALIGVLVTTSTVIFTGIQFWGGLRASRLLFRDLLRKLAYSTFRWFDSTPKGRILNRVGKDISTVDTALSESFDNFAYTLAQLSIAVVTVGVVFPYFLFPASLLSFAYYKLSVGYLHSSRDLRRMEANTRSPIFTGFSELLEGIVTVRAFGVEKRFLSEMYTKVDLTTRLGYNFWLTNRWLLLNFDYLGASAVFITSLLGISSFVPAGLAGICITSAMSFSRTSFLACRFYTSLQVDLNAVERVVNYLEIPQEPPAIIESQRPPRTGRPISLQFCTASASLSKPESEQRKIHPCDESLAFVEPSGGRIFVDGIDISKIGLNDLRTRLTFIPQDATLFSGTIRDNLDPFDEYEDAACRDALHRVHLLNRSANQSQTTSARATPVAELEGDTSTISGVSTVTELDQNQVQLFPWTTTVNRFGARPPPPELDNHSRRSHVSIDFETDQKIQTTIREEFKDSLLLTVAHRIKTVIDYDRLIILDKGKHDTTLSLTYYHLTIVAGKIAEFDTPYNLIQKKDGIFRDMCMKSGTFNELEAAAKGEK
ncbi:multidrug resistance-associated ABC transporter [Mycena leptocephala]|nr:multidrug resistance-associated ABC transporter [Mycena leptocephala]